MKNDQLRPRHWSLLLSQSGVDAAAASEEGGRPPQDGLEVKTFISLDQAAFEGIINGVVDVAQEEANIEGRLTVIRKRWEDRKFVLSRELIGNTSSHKLTVINQIDKLHEEVGML